MTTSMTGFGSASRSRDGRTATVEAKSVNHRHLVVKWRMPARLARHESRFEERVRGCVARGSLEIGVRIDAAEAAAAGVDLALARRYADSIRTLDPAAAIDWAGILALPGVVDSTGPDVADDAEVSLVDDALGGALAELVAMRRKEGARLAAELDSIVTAAAAQLDRIEARAAMLPAATKARLEQRLGELLAGGATSLDPAALEREAAFLADRGDVREEIARLRSHFEGFRETMAKRGDGVGAIGRALDFQVQEMGREANTIGSKIADAEGARGVVALKTAIERLREQVQNIE